jgi:hypothetical protein
VLRIIRYTLGAAIGLVLVLAAALLTLPRWLAPVLSAALPSNWQLDALRFVPRPPGLPRLTELVVSAGGCTALRLGPAEVQLEWRGARPVLERVDIDALTLDPACVPPGPATAAVDLPSWVGPLFAGMHLAIRELTVAGRPERLALSLRIDRTEDGLAWSGEASAAGGLGPVRAAGHWSGGVLTGRATLERQALRALQPLLPPTLPVELQAGRADLEADLSWSRASPSDLRVTGELRVADGRVAMAHAAGQGVDLRLPFDYSSGVLRIGTGQAARLRAERVTAAVDAEAVGVRASGNWPWTARRPLRIEDLRLQLLGGEVTLERLRLPQGAEPALLRLRGIDLEQVSALYGHAGVGLAGVVEADLPLHLDDATRVVTGGQVRNAGPLRLRLTDAAALEAFQAGNPALAQAADWLSDLHVDRLEGTVNLLRDGTLLLEATVEGRNPARGERAVRLNYRHEENLLHLVQSLRIGTDLSRRIEEGLTPGARSGP